MPFLLLALAFLIPPTPTGIDVRVGDGSVIVRAEPVPGATGYRVYRSEDGGAFEEISPALLRYPRWVDFRVENGKTYHYRMTSADASGESEASAAVEARPRVLTDDEFLDLVARTAFDYFWYEANPANGLIKDRSTENSAASIAAVGFGLTGYGVAADRGWITREQARARTLATLSFFWNAPQNANADATGYRGFFYHFLNMQTGRRAGSSELSTIDTALLLGGILYAKQYFDDAADADEARIRALADSIYARVEWTWATPNPPRVALGWKPELTGGVERNGFRVCNGGFCDWVGYNEAMILYLLALGSPTHALSPISWLSWTSGYRYEFHYGHRFVVFPPLFGHQYSHVWYDFRNLGDAYMRDRGLDYFENSRRATLAQRAYTTANPGRFAGYGPNGWGITASDVPTGYRARGAPPSENDDGTLAPTGPGGSYPFTPDESLAALRDMYSKYKTRLWGVYGFRDAFNVGRDWYATDFLGIDQGPILLMIENGRREAVWNVFMRDEHVRRGLERAGFSQVVGVEEDERPSSALVVTPNPVRTNATIRYTLEAPGAVVISVYDALGRKVTVLAEGMKPSGEHLAVLDASTFAPGAYFAIIRLGERTYSESFVRLP